MSGKAIGGICAIISMVSVVVYFLIGMITKSYENAWIVFIIGGVACASVSIVAGIKSEKKKDAADTKEE